MVKKKDEGDPLEELLGAAPASVTDAAEAKAAEEAAITPFTTGVSTGAIPNLTAPSPLEQLTDTPTAEAWTPEEQTRHSILQSVSKTKITAEQTVELEALTQKKRRIFNYAIPNALQAFLQGEDYKAYQAFMSRFDMGEVMRLLEAAPEDAMGDAADEWRRKSGTRAMRIGALLTEALWIKGTLKSIQNALVKRGVRLSAESVSTQADAEASDVLMPLLEATGRMEAACDALLTANFSIRLQIDILDATLGIARKEMSLLKTM